MPDLNYTLGVETKNAEQNLQSFRNKVAGLDSAFGKLRGAIAGLAIGSAITSAIRYADSIKDVSDATGVAIQNVIGFGKAVSAAGGSMDAAQNALTKFNLSIGEAASGSDKAQQAFAEVGVSLDDLRNLSEQGLFEKALDGLSRMEDGTKRARLQNELFGKGLKGVNLKGLSDDYRAASAASARYAEDVRKSAELNDKLDAAFSTLKLKILQAIEPLVDFINGLKPEQIERFVDAVVKIGGAAASIVVLTRGIGALTTGFGYLATAIGLAWATFKGGAILVTSGIASISGAMPAIITGFRAVTAAITGGAALAAGWGTAMSAATAGVPIALGAIALGLGKIALVIAAVSAVAWALDKAIKAVFDVSPIDWFLEKVKQAYQAFKEFIGLGSGTPTPDTSGAGGGRGNAQLHLDLYKKQQEELARVQEQNQKRIVEESEVAKRLAQQRAEIQRISEGFKAQLDTRAGQLQLETNLIGKSERQRDLMTALADLNAKTTDEVNKLREAQAGLNEEQKKGGLAAEYDKQIAAVQSLARAEQTRLAALVKGLNDARDAQEFQLYVTKQQQDVEDQLLNLQREMADITLPRTEKAYRDIERAAYDSATAAIRAEEARRGEPLKSDEVKKYYDTAAAGAKKLVESQKKLTEANRSFSTGWKRAFNEYKDAATNAADVAGRIFGKFTSGLEDAIVNFAKTGKFEWRAFVADMAETLLRSQIQSTIASLGDALGLGDLFGGGGSASTKGQSANNPLYVIDVSGGGAGGAGGGVIGSLAGLGQQKGGLISGGGIGGGGGILGGLGNVASSIGSGIGKVVDTVGSIAGGVWDTVSSIGSSIGDWFGGFFANGGTLPANKFGIVGERGPEMISGPASITPMTGGGSVTYNIQAVDAASFQALVARDPGFIHAVAMQGARGVPTRR